MHSNTKKIEALPEGFSDTLGATANRLFPKTAPANQSQVAILEHRLAEVRRQLNAARMGGSGNIGRLSKQKGELGAQLAEAKEAEAAESLMEAKMSGNYAQVIYNYREDYYLITVYKNGKKVASDDGYFGANETGNPLIKKFIDVVKKAGLRPEGLPIVDEDGKKGVFKGNKFNWNMKEEVELDEALASHIVREGLDKPDEDELEGEYDDRKDKDIDNDGDEDDSDEYLHNRRKAISKAMKRKQMDEAKKPTFRDMALEYEKITGKKAPAGTSTQAMMVILDKAKKSMSEEVELDEISKKTLVNYMDKSKKQTADIQKKFKKGTETKDDEKRFDRRVSGQVKALDKFHGRSKVPAGGTDKSYDAAQKALRKEEIEIIEAAMKGNYARVTYDYREDYYHITVYKNGKEVASDDGYFGANETGNPLIKKFTDLVKKAGLKPEGLPIVDEDGKKGVFKGNKFKWNVKEEIEIIEAKGGYTINHKTFSSAVQHAKAQVEKQGYTIDDDEWDRKVAMGPKKPGTGKTNRYTIDLMKGGKETRRKLQMQVYYDEGRYELNMYVS